jgi:HPt (histidine-containing phosphotransfer) domain-containing protein
MTLFRKLFARTAPGIHQADSGADTARFAELQARCEDLEQRLRSSDQKLKERSELLYELQQQYSSEHFGLQESMRNLKIERMRNAGAFADRDILIARSNLLAQRIGELKERLRRYEAVEDRPFDSEPIVRQDDLPG